MALAAMVGFADHSRRHDVWPIGMHGGAHARCGGIALAGLLSRVAAAFGNRWQARNCRHGIADFSDSLAS